MDEINSKIMYIGLILIAFLGFRAILKSALSSKKEEKATELESILYLALVFACYELSTIKTKEAVAVLLNRFISEAKQLEKQ